MAASQTNAADAALVHLRNARGDTAGISLHGGQLLSWKPAAAGEQLYRSPLSAPAPGKAVRGGAPICFPQFSDRGPLPKHGLVRTSRWELVAAPLQDHVVAEARLQVDSSTVTVRWEHAFCLVLLVRLGPRWIEVELQAANTGRTAFEFTAAIHTYLALADVRAAQLQGLGGCWYEDNLMDGRRLRAPEGPLAIVEEIDRVYLDVPQPLVLDGPPSLPLRIAQTGFADLVVWNPGPAKAASLGDMPPDDWQRMLCVEAATVARPVTLAPGKTWHGTQRLELPPAYVVDDQSASCFR